MLIFLFFFFSCIVVIIVPTAAHPSSCSVCPNHNPSCSRRFFPSYFLSPTTPLVLRSQTNIYRLNAAATRHPCALLYLILVFPYAYISLYSILSSTPPKPPLLYYRRHTLRVASLVCKTALLLAEEGIASRFIIPIRNHSIVSITRLSSAVPTISANLTRFAFLS